MSNELGYDYRICWRRNTIYIKLVTRCVSLIYHLFWLSICNECIWYSRRQR